MSVPAQCWESDSVQVARTSRIADRKKERPTLTAGRKKVTQIQWREGRPITCRNVKMLVGITEVVGLLKYT